MSKEKSRGNREKKKPKANKKTAPAAQTTFLRTPPAPAKGTPREAAKE
jgi:hypothetical protein